VQSASELGRYQSAHDSGSAVGRSVVDYQYVETFLEGEYRTYNLLDILLLVIGRYNYYTITLMHTFYL
jgi:hypothetical protein